MKSYVMGIDFGSTTSKTVILDMDGGIVASAVSHKGSVSDEGAKASIAEALAIAGITQKQVVRAVSTGYGRRMLEVSDKSYTEITCHARGAIAMVPEARMVIDIGGQDSKVIAIDALGLVSQFAMNDRCAAGTGKFLEALARAVGVPLEEMGPMALRAVEDITISSMCATFAETEVVALLAEGKSKTEVLGAVHAAIAARLVGLVSRVGKREPLVMTGGVAQNPAAVRHLEKALDLKLIIPQRPQIAGALGALLFAAVCLCGPAHGLAQAPDPLLDWRTILDNVLLTAEFQRRDLKALRPRAQALLARFGLDGFENRHPWELSGGMRQRAAICRALLVDPDLLLMDEPFGALDAMTRDDLNVELARLWQDTRKTVLFITHSITEAVFLSDRVVMLSRNPGRIVEVIDIDLPRPRPLRIRETPEFGRYTARIRHRFAELGVLKEE